MCIRDSIFPIAWCEKKGISKSDYNCIVNKTPLSARTNRIVGGDPPSEAEGTVLFASKPPKKIPKNTCEQTLPTLCVGTPAVSYTHLDVYKRQGINWIRTDEDLFGVTAPEYYGKPSVVKMGDTWHMWFLHEDGVGGARIMHVSTENSD